MRSGPVWCLALALLMAQACHPPSNATDDSTAASTDSAVAPDGKPGGQAGVSPAACYLHVHGSDSIKLQLAVEGDTARGKLQFKNYQIDGSSGTVSGQFHGDTLLVCYDFFAEGTYNRTEEAFLKRGDRYIRGFGDRQEVDGVYRFTDKRAIDFSNGQAFHPVACDVL